VNYKKPRKGEYTLRVKRGVSGLGLFAEEDIPKGSFLVEYYGPFLTDKQADRKGGKYLFTLDDGRVVDGTPRKNIARYVNHSCKPNAEMEIEGSRLFLYSIKKIKEDEELLYDYGKEYFDDFIKPHGCKCPACKEKKHK
jgi:SET domain-containing protein